MDRAHSFSVEGTRRLSDPHAAAMIPMADTASFTAWLHSSLLRLRARRDHLPNSVWHGYHFLAHGFDVECRRHRRCLVDHSFWRTAASMGKQKGRYSRSQARRRASGDRRIHSGAQPNRRYLHWRWRAEAVPGSGRVAGATRVARSGVGPPRDGCSIATWAQTGPRSARQGFGRRKRPAVARVLGAARIERPDGGVYKGRRIYQQFEDSAICCGNAAIETVWALTSSLSVHITGYSEPRIDVAHVSGDLVVDPQE